MNVKDIIEVDIENSGMNGDGVARVDGRVVFVPYTLRGERVRAVVKSVKKSYATASVVKVLTPSPHRIEPTCKHYYKCGGCDTCHIDDEYRREILLAELKNNLKKIAGIDYVKAEFVPSRGAPRNKIAMPFGLSGGKVVLGMYRQGTHDVEPVDCIQALEPVREIVRTVCKFANEKNLSVYNDATGRGLLRHLVVRHIGSRSAVVLVINGSLPHETELSAMLPRSCDFFVSCNTRRGNVIMGESARLVRGNAFLPVEVLGVKAELSPLSFFQVNDYIMGELYNAALKNITSSVLVDLYSGIGITSNLAARKCDSVYAVECVPQAVENANRTAELNGNADRIVNFCGNVEDVLPKIAERIDGERNVDVLVDPPRKGCGESVMNAVAELAPNTVVYISCNHATMCRDIKPLVANGYTFADCRVFDMFPGTHHCEVLTVLKKRG